MKIYVSIPINLSTIKTKVLWNLTKRQIICFGCGIAVGVPLYFLCKSTLGSSASAMVMIITMLPAFLFAMYERNGETLDVRIRHLIDSMYRKPKIRLYKMKGMGPHDSIIQKNHQTGDNCSGHASH